MHNQTIYTANFEGKQVYLLHQVDELALACTNQELADRIYDIIGQKQQQPNEYKPPFAKMGLINDFNGIDVFQTNSYIKISCATYIDWLVTTHGWKEDKQIKKISKTIAPISNKVLKQVYDQKGPTEGTIEHKTLQTKACFSYQTLLSDMMYAYVTCRPDIGYTITLLLKFGLSPSEYHYCKIPEIHKGPGYSVLQTCKKFWQQASQIQASTRRTTTSGQPPKLPRTYHSRQVNWFFGHSIHKWSCKQRSIMEYMFTYLGVQWSTD